MNEPTRAKLIDELPPAQRERCYEVIREWHDPAADLRRCDAVAYQYRYADEAAILRACKEILRPEGAQLVAYTEEIVLPDGSLLEPLE